MLSASLNKTFPSFLGVVGVAIYDVNVVNTDVCDVPDVVTDVDAVAFDIQADVDFADVAVE